MSGLLWAHPLHLYLFRVNSLGNEVMCEDRISAKTEWSGPASWCPVQSLILNFSEPWRIPTPSTEIGFDTDKFVHLLANPLGKKCRVGLPAPRGGARGIGLNRASRSVSKLTNSLPLSDVSYHLHHFLFSGATHSFFSCRKPWWGGAKNFVALAPRIKHGLWQSAKHFHRLQLMKNFTNFWGKWSETC